MVRYDMGIDYKPGLHTAAPRLPAPLEDVRTLLKYLPQMTAHTKFYRSDPVFYPSAWYGRYDELPTCTKIQSTSDRIDMAVSEHTTVQQESGRFRIDDSEPKTTSNTSFREVF